MSQLATAVASLSTTTTQPAPAAQAKATVMEAVLPAGYVARQQMLQFLQVTYDGGAAYKDAVDSTGNPVLVRHEAESGDTPVTLGAAVLGSTAAMTTPEQARYQRRKAMACYVNHVRPIVDKVTGYLTRTPPQRSPEVSAEQERLDLDYHLAETIRTGLSLGEAWIGWDAARMPTDPDTGKPLPMTELQLEVADPENKGMPYIVCAHPQRVVDWDEAEGGDITRVVIEERHTAKGSFTAAGAESVMYREWTASGWVLYRRVDSGAIGPGGKIKVQVDSMGTHSFGRCPWLRFCPRFPSSDLAELSKHIFNFSSLLAEELAQCTFTQHWVTGERAENLKKVGRAAGNMLVLEPENAKVGSFGSMPEQGRVLMEQVDRCTDSLYLLVSMENTGQKNVAETAEKKKRDMEALYTMLLDIVGDVEELENELLQGLGLLEDDDGEARTQYDRQFDVQSVADLIANMGLLNKLPFMPPALSRKLAVGLAQKLDPLGDHDEYEEQVQLLPNNDPAVVSAVAEMLREGMAVPELVCQMLAIPEAFQPAVTAAMAQHAQTAAELTGQLQAATGGAKGTTPPGEPDGSGDGTAPTAEAADGNPNPATGDTGAGDKGGPGGTAGGDA